MFIQEWLEISEQTRSSKSGYCGKLSLLSIRKVKRVLPEPGRSTAVGDEPWVGAVVVGGWAHWQKCGPKQEGSKERDTLNSFSSHPSVSLLCLPQARGKGRQVTDVVEVSSASYRIRKRRMRMDLRGDMAKDLLMPHISNTTLIFLTLYTVPFGFVFSRTNITLCFFLLLWLSYVNILYSEFKNFSLCCFIIILAISKH